MKTLLPILVALTAAVSLSACASDGDMWGHGRDHDRDHHDHDRDGDRHGLIGALSVPAPLTATITNLG